MLSMIKNLFRIVRVDRHQRVAVIRNGRFVRLLAPGRHVLWPLGAVVDLVSYDVRAIATRMDRADGVPEQLPDSHVIEVAPHEIALVRLDGVLQDVLSPGRFRVWEAVQGVGIVTVDVMAEPAVLDPRDRVPEAVGLWADEASATPAQAVVLTRDGQPVRRLPQGRFRVWKAGPYALTAVSLALEVVEPAAQDLMTRDEVPVRVKASVSTRIVDPVQALREPQRAQQVYGAVQLALREAVAARTLDGLIEDREALSGELLARVRAALPEVGVAVEAAFVKDVILSAETKQLVSRVSLARKEAEALAITRREEVAATRQQANTAKVLQSNPVLLRLKELEAMTEMVSRIDKLVVVGSPDLVTGPLLRQLADPGEA